MRIFHCPSCKEPLFFGNLTCSCGLDVTFDPVTQQFVPAEARCANRPTINCNWKGARDDALCRSCAMTTVHPDLSLPGNDKLWRRAEFAKRWALTGLMRWRWFTRDDYGTRPEFHMLSENTQTGPVRISMGHMGGVVTINVIEADHAEREERREELDESYRTVIGHIRHEIAHFLFERLTAKENFIARFRPLFGDETADYAAALNAHYLNGPRPDWRTNHISAYASSHPHEDWAESVAHLFHITDIVDSFSAAHLTGADLPRGNYNAYTERNAERLIGYGLRLGVALNHVNRSMGLSDIYPFVTSPGAIEKLKFAHYWLTRKTRDAAAAA